MSHSGSPKAYDALVVGAGVIGLAVGWRAAQRGLRTLVIDAAEAGSGATRVAAGMLAPVTEATWGEESLLALNLESARRYPAFVGELEAETGCPTGYRPSGTLAVALDRDDAELLKRLHSFQLSLGLESEWLRGRDCRRLEPALSPKVVGGISSSLDHQVSPRELVRGLARALRLAGGELCEQTPVVSVTVEADRVRGVELATGDTVRADSVVLAAGWRSAALAGLPVAARVPLRPVKGQILRLRADAGAPTMKRVVRTPEVYVVPRGDGTVVVGATVEERGDDAAVTAGGVLDLLRAAYAVLPGIAELALTETSAGLRPASPDNSPLIGAGRLEGLVWATGHWRHGILLAPVTADAIASLLADGAPPPIIEPFSPGRFAGDAVALAEEAAS